MLSAVFSVVDRVLALLPIISSPFRAKFSGPYEVVKQVSGLNYIISSPERRENPAVSCKPVEAFLSCCP